MSYSSVGLVFDPPSFASHIETLNLSWADSVCIHHTGYPDLSMRPKGWTIQHMRNLASYYGTELKWKAGPHLFTDEDQIFGLSPLTSPGTHAVSFNRYSIGIEMLGNYDREDPLTGRGHEVVDISARATAILLIRLRLEPSGSTVKFHRDDPKTSKTCPGTRLTKERFLELVSYHHEILTRKKSATEDASQPDTQATRPPVTLTIEERITRLEASVFP